MKFLETATDVEKFSKSVVQKNILLYPIQQDPRLHPCTDKLSCLCISVDEELYIFGVNHNETVNPTHLDLMLHHALEKGNSIWWLDKKYGSHLYPIESSNVREYDVNSLEYLDTNTITQIDTFYTPVHKQMYQMYHHINNVNNAIPIMKHIEMVEAIFAHMKLMMTSHIDNYIDFSPYIFLNDIALIALKWVERSGISIAGKEAEFVEKYGSKSKKYIYDHKVYSLYNLYTKTGRPSNKFGGVNFAALNTTDGTRELLTSKSEKDVLVSIDFESFHVRLVADMIGYPLPTDIPLHLYFGRQYFDKQELTDEEYAESKKITFELMYGSQRVEGLPPFFQKIYEYIDILEKQMQTDGYIESPYWKRRIYAKYMEDPTPSKIFNYLIQLAETEIALEGLHTALILAPDCIVPELYTYDSILLNYTLDYKSETLRKFVYELSRDGKFPVRVFYGMDYQNMKQIEI